MAPVAPFYAERLYKDLTGEESVHLSNFPTVDQSLINPELEQKMQLAQTISSLVLSLRQKEKIKVRQPLQKVMIPVLNSSQRETIQAISGLIKQEVNVKEVELIDEDSGILVKKIKPHFKTLGPRFGSDLKEVTAVINGLSQKEIKEFEREGKISVEINGKSIILHIDEVEITSQDIEGWLVSSDQGVTVALDITITDSLRGRNCAG